LGNINQRITVHVQSGQKVCETPISNNKLGMVLHASGASYGEAQIGGLLSKAGPREIFEVLSKK
jgi:hypothetical protein